MRKRSLPAGLRRQVLAEGDFWCVYCDFIGSEVDHVIPVSRGGSDARTNLVVACWRCNREKLTFTPDEWKEWRIASGRSWPPPHIGQVHSRWIREVLACTQMDDSNMRARLMTVTRDPSLLTPFREAFDAFLASQYDELDPIPPDRSAAQCVAALAAWPEDEACACTYVDFLDIPQPVDGCPIHGFSCPHSVEECWERVQALPPGARNAALRRAQCCTDCGHAMIRDFAERPEFAPDRGY